MAQNRFGTRNAVCFTLNNYTDEDEKQIQENEKFIYIVYGIEVGENGTPHLQGFAQSNRRYSQAWWKKQLPRAHLEVARGTPQQNIDYCKKGLQSKTEWEEFGIDGENYGKDAVIFEKGEVKEGREGQGKRTDIKEIRNLVMVEHGSMVDVINIASSYQALRGAQIMMSYRPYKSNDLPKQVNWFYGPTGTGKTQTAMQEILATGDSYWISNDTLQWFDGYFGQRNVLIDDFRTTMCKYNYLLRLLDRYPLRVQIKGGYVEWEPQTIWITSNKSPEDLYTFEEKTRDDIAQLLRRITRIVSFENQQVLNDMYSVVNSQDIEIEEIIDVD